ncbi:NADH-quinone oxidoreductase subunit A [Micromonospora sp. MED01]|uniref:NADH-quinone oxidoreductase subunit A n=1 Tax=Micromonospora alfalfae TaxID=2911212 RepID=UPI001EE9840F|nr:NADH-quinone oxidoreductase subunit A [Micromonospora alfalfae]MCG5466605.1 NADH-quinone oxidoreductase subunit A [Micromonospora alfalfae]
MYAGAAGMALVAVLIVAGLYLAHRAVAIASAPLTVLPFQSGWPPEEHALSRYHVRWYLATLLFLAFDVEMLFMYPWAVVVAQLGITAIVEMFIFLGSAFIAVLWAWREGALRWA